MDLGNGRSLFEEPSLAGFTRRLARVPDPGMEVARYLRTVADAFSTQPITAPLSELYTQAAAQIQNAMETLSAVPHIVESRTNQSDWQRFLYARNGAAAEEKADYRVNKDQV